MRKRETKIVWIDDLRDWTGSGTIQDLTRFNKIAIQGTPQMAVHQEAIFLFIELIENLLIRPDKESS